MGISHRIDAVITSVEVGWRKPHPAIFAESLRRLGIASADAVFVGDSHGPDYLGPRAAGIDAFLIDPDHRHNIPDARRLRALPKLIDRLAIRW